MLDVVREQFQLSSRQMHKEIQDLVKGTSHLLKEKGVQYDSLKGALVPQIDRRELALVFDSLAVEGDNYATPGHERLLKLLDRSGTRSILSGDYLDHGLPQPVLHNLLGQSLISASRLNYRHSSQFYFIYVNNLTQSMVESIHKSFSDMVGYVGFVDTTYASPLKWLLSATLGFQYIQYKGIIIGPHEDDRRDYENINLLGLPFERSGYVVRSIPAWRHGVLLSYKIERPPMSGDSDIEFSLNAVHPEPKPLTDLEIIVDERKFAYLSNEKAESLRRLGLLGSSARAMSDLIKAKIDQNYIYSMAYSDDYDVTQFNVMIEVSDVSGRPFRVLAGLKYLSSDGAISLITLF